MEELFWPTLAVLLWACTALFTNVGVTADNISHGEAVCATNEGLANISKENTGLFKVRCENGAEFISEDKQHD